MTGFATFAYSKKYFVSQEIEFISESEIDPEVGESYKAPQDLIRLLADNVGIGTTNITTARQELDVYGTAIVSGRVGIATTQPREELDVIGTVIVSDSVGVGTTNPTGKLQVGVASSIFIVTGIGSVGIGSTRPEQRLDISGSVKIDANIFDSANSPGVNGAFLNRDANGIRWVTFTPNFSEGIFIQDDGTYIPVVGAAQSFTVLNFKEINSLGIGTTTITPIPNPDNPTLIADIRTQDFWGYTAGGDIYRMTKVGIQNNNPSTTLDITGTLHATGAVDFDSTLNVDGATTLQTTLNVKGSTDLDTTLNVDGATTLNSTLDVDLGTTLNSTLDVDGATTLNSTLDVDGSTTLSTTLQVGIGGTVITTTGIGSVGIGTNFPTKDIDLSKDVLIRKALYDSNRNVGYKTEFYKTPRTVLGQVGVNTAGEVISDRFFDAANLIRLNLDFIAAEAVGFITSTDYLSGSFSVPGVSSCRDDIKKILKSITLDITKGGNSQSVGAGLSYYNGGSLIHITSGAQQTATIVAITTAAQISQKVINNVLLTKSYQSGVSSIRQIRDLTIQDDASVNSNANFGGCSNVVSAIYTCAGIVTAIIGGGTGSAPPITQPDGKVVWVPPGTDVRNLVWVNKYGNDDNGGRTEGDAKLTIAAAAAVAQPGDTIMVRSGVYYENNPIGLRTDVSITGQDLRLVTVVPQNSGKDVFHVRRGCLIENLNFACDTGQSNPGGAAVAFPPTDSTKFAASGFIASGPATEGTSGRWRSPYIRNCTNFMSKSIGMKIDGNHATASTIGADLKSMVCDSFTQYNEAGIGVSLTNNGYAQLVSIFTINCDIAIFAGSGGQCDLTNSNSSFGNFGLVAVGLGSTEFTGKVNTTTTSETDTIIFKEVEDGSGNVRRPYDGQALWFKIDLVNYNTGQVGIITAPLQQLKSITVVNGGSGFSQAAPPDITIFDTNTLDTLPLGPEGIVAELSPTISDSGAITSVDVVNNGRNYLSSQPIGVRVNGISTNDLVAVMEPIFYTVGAATSTTPVTGITTVTLNQFLPYLVYEDDEIEMRRISRILTSGHSFEYIGTGTDINTSTPLKGAVPIKENEIVFRDGGQIPFTSTDQQGNFNIGEGIQINQQTSTITGRDFSKAIQAEVTPLILALR